MSDIKVVDTTQFVDSLKQNISCGISCEFRALFVGGKTKLNGLTVIPGKEYTLEYSPEIECNGWLWFKISTTEKYNMVFSVRKSAWCPYQSIDTFLNNWLLAGGKLS